MKNRKIPFSSRQDIARNSINKKIVLFGAGNIAHKTFKTINQNQIIGIVDNSKNLINHEQIGFRVKDPNYLKKFKSKEIFIIICSTSFVEISEQLINMGFIPNENFIVSPILNDLRIIDELETIKKRLFFSSGSPSQPDSEYGGGIYELNVNLDKWTCKKRIDGNCYGMISFGNNYVAIDTDMGIFEFDNDFNIIRKKRLPEHSRAHGIAYSDKYKQFYITCSYLDAVLILDKDFEEIGTINLSKKQLTDGSPQHHCNDCFVINDSLFISMFSVTGNWKVDIFDGGIVEYNIKNNEFIGVLTNDLWMPHNVKVFDRSLYVLDSLRGYLKGNNLQILGDFPAFTRGLAFDDEYFFIGQSRNRNYSKNLGVKKNIAIDAGIIVFDAVTHVSRFLQVSPKISEIHSIVIAQ